jgi:sugar lactone lactonase YvrE
MAEQGRLLSSVECPSGQLSEVCFESPVGSFLWVDHREITAKSALRDGCFLVS